MSMPYRVDFFDRTFIWKGFSLISNPELSFDYLTLDASKISLPGVLPVERDWYAHITAPSKTPWQGIVSAVTNNGKTTSVSVKPLLALFNVDVITTPDNLTSAERYIADIISTTFIDTTDLIEKIPGLSVSVLSDTANVTVASESETQNLHDVIVHALESAQIIIDMKLKPMSKEIIANIVRVDKPAIKINADIIEITDKAFSFRDDYGQINKVVVFNKDKPTEQAVFYAENYTAPCVRKVISVSLGSDDTFSVKAQEAANKELAAKNFDNYIELKYPINCKLLPDIAIGQEANVYYSGAVYTSFLTGWELSDNSITLFFGSVRLDLTKILKLEGIR